MIRQLFLLFLISNSFLFFVFTELVEAKDLEINSSAGVFTLQKNSDIYPVAYINPFAPGLTWPGSNPLELKVKNTDLFSPTIIPRITGMVVPSVISVNLKNTLDSEISGILTIRIQTILNGEKIPDTESSEMSNLYRPIISNNLILPAHSNQNYLYNVQLWIPDYLETKETNRFNYLLRTVFTLNDGRMIARDTIELRTFNPEAVHCIVLDDLDLNTENLLPIPGFQLFTNIQAETGLISPSKSKLVWYKLNQNILSSGSSNLETIWCIALKQKTWDKLSALNRQILREYSNIGGLVFIVGNASENEPELTHGSIVKVLSTFEINQKLTEYHVKLLWNLYYPKNTYKSNIQKDSQNAFIHSYSPPTDPDLKFARSVYVRNQRFFPPAPVRSTNQFNITNNQLHPLWVARRISRAQSNLNWLYGEDGTQVKSNIREKTPTKPGNWLVDWAEYLTNKTQTKLELQSQNLRLSISSLVLAIILLFVPSQLYRIVLIIGLAVLALLINAPIKAVHIQDNFKIFSYVASLITHKSADFQFAEVFTNKSDSLNVSMLNQSITEQEVKWNNPPRVAQELFNEKHNEDFVDYRLTTGRFNIDRMQDSTVMFRISQIGTKYHHKLIISSTRVVDDALLIYKGRSYPLGRIVPERPVIAATPENLSRRVLLSKYSINDISNQTALWDYDNIWSPIKGAVFKENSMVLDSICSAVLTNIEPENNLLPGIRNFYRAYGLAQWQSGVLPSEFDPEVPLIIWMMKDLPSWMKSSVDKSEPNHNNVVFIGVTQVKLPIFNQKSNSENE